MAISKLRKAGFKYDRKTGRKVRINIKRSRIAKRAARKRLHRHLTPAIRTKISRGLRNTLRRHRTKFGRRLLRKIKHLTNKPYRPGSVARHIGNRRRRRRIKPTF